MLSLLIMDHLDFSAFENFLSLHISLSFITLIDSFIYPAILCADHTTYFEQAHLTRSCDRNLIILLVSTLLIFRLHKPRAMNTRIWRIFWVHIGQHQVRSINRYLHSSSCNHHSELGQWEVLATTHQLQVLGQPVFGCLHQFPKLQIHLSHHRLSSMLKFHHHLLWHTVVGFRSPKLQR